MANGTVNLNEIKAKAAEMFVYFSLMLGKGVRTSDGVFLGYVWDMSARLGEVYPRSEELIIYKGFFNRTYASLPWSQVVDIDGDIVVNAVSGMPAFSPGIKEYEFLLRRDVLDQQVVDTFNHKVRRVNDIHFLKVDRDLVVAHVDIGLRGLVRRLGWEKPVDIFVRMASPRGKYLKDQDLVSWKFVQPVSINPASMTMKLSVSEKQLLSIPAADLGEIIFDLNPAQRMALFRTLDIKTKARVFEHLEFEEQKSILRELDKKEAALIVTHMSSDEAADFLEKLPHATLRNLLTLVESSMSKKLSALLGYSGDSAGGLMTTEYVALPETITVEAALEYVKNNTRDIDVVPYIYLVDDKNHLKGTSTIRRLLFADAKDAVSKTAFSKTLSVSLGQSVKELAYFIDKYKVSAIPVVDENKVLHGIITIDDILSRVTSIAWRKRPAMTKGL